MSLPSTYINVPDLLTLLGLSTPISLGAVCVDSGINKWSKYKPIRDTGAGPNWPAGSNSKYGLNLPTNWDYLKPRGKDLDEWYRPSDFRGYEHSILNAFPSIQLRDTDNTFITDVYPSGSPSEHQQWFKVRAYRSASNVIIIPSDLGMDNYYLCVKVSVDGTTYYKTYKQINELDFSGDSYIYINAEIKDWTTTPVYYDFPGSAVSGGSVTWVLCLCSSLASSWTTSAPSNLIEFPTGTDGTHTWVKTGSFTIHNWLVLSDDNIGFDLGGGYIDITVYCTSDVAFTLSDDQSWITTAVYQNGNLVNNPALYRSTMQVRVTASAWSNACSVTCIPVMRESGGVPIESWDFISQSGSISGGGSRSGTVTVSLDGRNYPVSVGQGSTGSNQLTFTFKPDNTGDFPPSVTPIDVWINRGYTTVFSDLTGSYFTGRANVESTYTVTINETAALGVSYDVYIRIH